MAELLECYTCRQDEPALYRVKLRGDVRAECDPAGDGSESLPYQHYAKKLTYRSASVCEECYCKLDSVDGTAEIRGRGYGIAGVSRGGKAKLYDAVKHAAIQKRQATRLGLS